MTEVASSLLTSLKLFLFSFKNKTFLFNSFPDTFLISFTISSLSSPNIFFVNKLFVVLTTVFFKFNLIWSLSLINLLIVVSFNLSFNCWSSESSESFSFIKFIILISSRLSWNLIFSNWIFFCLTWILDKNSI